jgi:hypothetical protein
MCTPSEIVVLRFKLKESYENILDDGTRKEPSATKPQLFGAIWSLFRDLEAATSAPVIVRDKSGDDDLQHVDSEDLEDLTQSQSQSQGSAYSQPKSCLSSHSQSQSRSQDSTYSSQSQVLQHAQARTQTQIAVEGERQARMELVKATRIAQEMTQADAQEVIRAKQEATADSKKAKKGDRYHAAVERLGRPPPCPILCRSEECSGSPCDEQEETGLSYSHMDVMVVCKDAAHVSMATSATCLMFHKWPPRQKAPRPTPKPQPPAKNGSGGTSGARHPPSNNGNPRTGKPRQAGRGSSQQHQQQQRDTDHRRVIEKLNLELEVARTNASARTIGSSYASVVKGSFTTPPPPLPLRTPPPPPLQAPPQGDLDLDRRHAVDKLFVLYESQHAQMMEMRELLRK